MVKTLAKAWLALISLAKAYPAISAALVNIMVVLAARLGFHVEGAQLMYLFGVVTALSGAVVHSNVVPLAKLSEPVEPPK